MTISHFFSSNTYSRLNVNNNNNNNSNTQTPTKQQYSLLTKSQVTLYNDHKHIIAHHHTHLHTGVTYYTLTLQISKTDQARRGAIITIGHPIAVHAMLHYLTIHPILSSSLSLSSTTSIINHIPLFYLDSKALTRTHMIYMTRTVLTQLGLNASLYHGHSFRRGGATSLSIAGISNDIIQLMGRWKSDAYKLYIDIPIDKLLYSSRNM